MMHPRLALLLATLACAAALQAGQPPTTQQAIDESMDWLLKQSTPATAASTLPSSRPASPLTRPQDDEVRSGVVRLSTGKSLKGRIRTTREKPIRVWDADAKEYRDIPFALIRSAEAKVLWERDEKEWAFRESGSDIKVYSGRTYPARELVYTLTLLNGQTVTGGIVAPLYLELPDGAEQTWVLNKRQKGPVGQSLPDLAYVKRLELE